MNNVIPIHPVATACAAIPYADLVQSDRVHTSLYTNAAIFEEEMQKVFYANWIWVGHASEVPEPGNFKSTYIGQQPVVLVRDRKNALNVLLNRCRHRGATVCEHKKGKTASFVCLTTAGVMGWMVLCAACHILRVTATALTKPNSAW